MEKAYMIMDMALSLIHILYLLIPTIVTLNVTGVVYTPVNEDYSDGRKVIVKYRNATHLDYSPRTSCRLVLHHTSLFQ